MKPFKLVASLAMAFGAFAATVPAVAQTAANFPNKPIRFVVPFPGGGSTDPLARLIAQKMGETFGQTVVVENRPGGNAVIGTEHVSKAAPDGYTILMTATSHVTNPLLVKTTYDPLKDFVPVATMTATEMWLVTNQKVETNSLKEFIALAKSKPGALNYGSAGTGNPNHLAGELLDMMAGIKTVHVPYKGGGAAITDLIGGQIQFHYGTPLSVLPHIKAGRLKALATTGPARPSMMPQIAPIGETVPGYEIRIWYGVLAPAGVPKDIVTKLANEIHRIMDLPETKARMEAAGMDRLKVSQEEFAAMLKADSDKFARIVKAANIKLN